MSIKRQTVWSLVPLLITAGAAVFSMPLLVKYLGTEMYAIYLYVTAISGIFGFADLGLGVVVGRHLSIALGQNDLPAVRRYWGTGNLIVLPVLGLATIAFIVITVWLGPWWFDQVSPANVGLFRACLVANGAGLFFGYYGTYWLTISQAYLDFKFIGLLRSVMMTLQIIPVLGLAYYTHNTLWVLLWSTLIGALQLGLVIWHARRHYSLGMCLGSARLACARDMAGNTSKMVVSLVVGSVFGSIDRNLLGKLASKEVFVPYGVASNIAGRLQSLSVSAMGPIFHNTARVANQGRASAAGIYNHTFAFMFEWYLFAAIWLGLWHPVILRLWLTHTMGAEAGQATAVTVGPLLIPLVAACCFTSMANISNSQLISLNRLGMTVGFAIAAGLLAVGGVVLGWRMDGIVGAAYGYLISRIALVAQDLYTIRLIHARGWLDPNTWKQMGIQTPVAVVFSLAYGYLPANSYWLLLPATVHGGLVAAWLLREPLRQRLARRGGLVPAAPAPKL